MVVWFANILRMLMSHRKVFYSPYLYLQGNLSNGLRISLQIFLWFRVRMAYLYLLISLVSSVNPSFFYGGGTA